MKLYTIGFTNFTKKAASTFFGLLEKSGAERLVDVRLNNVSQLAGFAKRDDPAYFLAKICGMDYHHELQLASTKSMLDDYKERRLMERLRALVPRLDCRTPDRGSNLTCASRQLRPALQRGHGTSLPSRIGRGVPRRSLERRHCRALVTEDE
jgi:hypothetical protein